MSEESIEGGCLCGAVRYAISGEPAVTGDCYCTDCRKASGTSHCTHAAFPEPAFAIEGQLRFFDKPADSGNMVSRCFCPTCGSAVYSTNSGMPGLVFVRASSLDDPERISPAMSVYASRAPSWAAVSAARPAFAEMPG
ncbi:GFA family protein [Hyphobacterium sp.]|jgi:hypothetical protein|uniref:GFA family protein n=1 Tax=Hyphobacterium sp. TaxID=2004662 RepID=UPI003BAC1657